ncbi:MAG: serine hydrolase domain-containing protein [Bryobacteraceae bacterium]|nr:serine hydrolase domain-containing protein [Bryobacteraceae bacterium]
MRPLLAFFLAAAALLAQALPTASPESLGLSPERLDRITAVVQRAIDEKRIAGAVTLIARRGKVGFLKAQGQMDREAGKPMSADALFRICSMTKPITSAAVMMLYEEGRFLLSDPVSKYLPEFKSPKVLMKTPGGAHYTVPANREITIKHLLTHTSGITYHWHADLGKYYQEAKVAHGILPYQGTIADSVKALAAQPLLFHPGERYEYGLNIDVLGRLVEVVSGKPLDQFFAKRIFEPLGMKDTFFFVPEEKMARLAAAYVYYDGKGLERFPQQAIVEGPFEYTADYAHAAPRKLFAGGAGLVSTAMDYALFCQMMLNGGTLNGKRLLSRKTVELMTTDHLGSVAPNFAFGLGFGISGAKAPLGEAGTPGQYNWGGFFYTTFFVDPKEQLILVFMGQLHPTGGLTLDRTVAAMANQAIID